MLPFENVGDHIPNEDNDHSKDDYVTEECQEIVSGNLEKIPQCPYPKQNCTRYCFVFPQEHFSNCKIQNLIVNRVFYSFSTEVLLAQEGIHNCFNYRGFGSLSPSLMVR